MSGNSFSGRLPELDENDPLLKPKADTKKADKQNRRRIQRVTYSASNHVQVLFQMYGSVLPQVFPFCIINVIWCSLIYILRTKNIVDITYQSQVGHSLPGALGLPTSRTDTAHKHSK